MARMSFKELNQAWIDYFKRKQARPLVPQPLIDALIDEFLKYFRQKQIPDLEIAPDRTVKFNYHGEPFEKTFYSMTELFEFLNRISKLRSRYWDYP